MNIIKCRTCKKEKPETEFGMYAGKLRRNCNTCREWLKDYNKKNREHLLEMRRFRYHTDPERKVAKANRKYMQQKRLDVQTYRRMKNSHLLRKYGISIEQYDKILELQNNKCAICEYEFPESKNIWNRPCVDHNHQTNKVRGILCRKCNIMLYWWENPQMKEAAIRYLEVNETKDKELL